MNGDGTNKKRAGLEAISSGLGENERRKKDSNYSEMLRIE